MTVDREQARMYARRDPGGLVANLLAEIEQVERERDEALSTSPLRIANAEIRRLRARLAKADALVEAAQNFLSYMDDQSYVSAPTFAEPFGAYFRALEAALDDWGQE